MAKFSTLRNKKPDKRSWATLEQIQWLITWLTDYIEAQQKRQLHTFWPKLFAAWFLDFPLREPTDDDASARESESEDDDDVPPSSADEAAVKANESKEKAKKKRAKKRAKKAAHNKGLSRGQKITGKWYSQKQSQLKTFMRWHSGATRAPRTKKGAEPLSLWFVADSAAKPRRRLQETEAYIHLHYKERILEVVNERVAAIAVKGPMINLIRQVAKELYEQEDDETRLAVKDFIKAHAEKLQSEAPETVDPTPEQYQDAINLLPSYFDAVLSEASTRTGWTFQVLMGGPMPVNRGEIQTASIGTGKNAFAATFKETYGDFESAIVRPYAQFIRSVYSSDVRAARSLAVEARDGTAEITFESIPHAVDHEDPQIVDSGRPVAAHAPVVNHSSGDHDSPGHLADDDAGSIAPSGQISTTTANNSSHDDDGGNMGDDEEEIRCSDHLSPSATAMLSPRFKRKTAAVARPPSPEKAPLTDVTTALPRPKPTPPGYVGFKRSLEERAAAERVAAATKLAATEERAAAASLAAIEERAAAASLAAIEERAAHDALAAAATAATVLAATEERAAAEALTAAEEEREAATALPDATHAAPAVPVTVADLVPPPPDTVLVTVTNASPGASTSAPDAGTRTRRKITQTAAGAEVAKEQAMKQARAKKAAETRAQKTAQKGVKRAAASDDGGTKKKQRVVASGKKKARS
ncbi:hypothetical protein HWV62_33613 [Athelia sp. TMB]|nr:hypothetical protein HWV62_33613 [Athelia sp. TMB]